MNAQKHEELSIGMPNLICADCATSHFGARVCLFPRRCPLRTSSISGECGGGMTMMTNQRRWMTVRTQARAVGLMACIVILMTVGLGLIAYGQDNAADQDLGLLRFESDGRVRLDVTDPNGNTVNRNVNEIESAVIVSEDHAVSVEITHSIPGIYMLDVNVSGSVNRLQRFSVWVTNGVDRILLADEELIVNVPVDAYVIRNSETGIEIATAKDEGSGMSSVLVWILIGGAGLIVGIAIFIIRSRKRKG